LNGYVTEVLQALVIGSAGFIQVNPPSGGWVPAPDYRVDFVQDAADQSTIYAQSGDFNITGSSTTSSTSSTSGATIVLPNPTANPTDTTGISGSSASSSASILPTSSSAAALSYSVQTGLLGLFSLLGFALA
jgi:hypothetical protein